MRTARTGAVRTLWVGALAWGALSASGPARAGTPVIHDASEGAAPEVVTAVSASTGLPPSQLTPRALDEILAAPPEVLGEAVIRRCTKTPSDGTQASAEVARAEVAWARADTVTANDHLDLAVAYLGCLKELVEGRTASRAFRLRAAVALSAGDVEAARGELRTSLAFQREQTWDASLPAEGDALLAEVRAGSRPVLVTLVPAGAPTGPWIDGRTVSGDLQLEAGLHLLQYGGPMGIRSAWVVVDGVAKVVVPSGFRRPVIERFAADPAGRTEVEALIAAAIPDFYAAYVYSAGGVWLVAKDEAGAIATTEITAPPPPPPPPEPGKKSKKKGSGRRASWGGPTLRAERGGHERRPRRVGARLRSARDRT